MQKATPFLWFNNNCEEAINFYTSIFPNSKIVSITRYPDGPLEGPMKGFEGKVLTAVFELFGQKFMGLDGGPNVFPPSGVVSFYIECEDQAEVDAYWNKLSEGSDPKTHQCGWITDKFGFTWQIIPKALPKLMTDPDKEKANRVTQAMLKMKKIEVAKLEEAYNQN
jgi:predicted 3-demethylubiquinone-9 3-methyltransferase (glyoxalase superfamily)